LISLCFVKETYCRSVADDAQSIQKKDSKVLKQNIAI